jgi:hypothetical protein
MNLNGVSHLGAGTACMCTALGRISLHQLGLHATSKSSKGPLEIVIQLKNKFQGQEIAVFVYTQAPDFE